MAHSDNAVREPSPPSEREVVITRTFEAPAARIFEMWTKPEHVARWWGPKGYTTTIDAMDARPGGEFRLVMHGPDGTRQPVKGVYKEVNPPRRLVYTEDWDLGDRPSVASVVTIAFDEGDGRTTATIHVLYETTEDRATLIDMGVREGWHSCLDRLVEELAVVES